MSTHTCVIYEVHLAVHRRHEVGTIRRHTDMNTWLLENGIPTHVYEIWKGIILHSRWCWKEKNKRWGRMKTPTNVTRR